MTRFDAMQGEIKMSYIPSDNDEYRQKDKVPSRWRRLLHKSAYKLNSIIAYKLTLNTLQWISLVLFTGVLFLIAGYLLASQYYEYLLKMQI